jgi:hypothetical protein
MASGSAPAGNERRAVPENEIPETAVRIRKTKPRRRIRFFKKNKEDEINDNSIFFAFSDLWRGAARNRKGELGNPTARPTTGPR